MQATIAYRARLGPPPGATTPGEEEALGHGPQVPPGEEGPGGTLPDEGGASDGDALEGEEPGDPLAAGQALLDGAEGIPQARQGVIASAGQPVPPARARVMM
jgi:hypothetical protein